MVFSGPANDVTGDDGFRRRLLDGLVLSIVEDGYQGTTVGGIVRRARTSRRTFYAHFAGKEDCFVALLADVNATLARRVAAAVDRRASCAVRVRQAVEAWLGFAACEPAVTLSLIRDLPTLADGYELHRETMAGLVTLVRKVCGAELSRAVATLVIGGLRELIATTLEEGGRPSDIADTAVGAVVALSGSSLRQADPAVQAPQRFGGPPRGSAQ